MTGARADSRGTDGRRAYGLALAALTVGGGVLLLGAGRSWATGVVAGGLGPEPFAVTGTQLAPGFRALGLLALAGVLAVLATRRTGRVLVGVALALGGAVAVVALVWYAVTLEDRVQDWLGTTGSAPAESVSGTGWPWVALVASALVAVAGATTARSGRRWPVLGARYERRRQGAPAGASAGEPPTRPEGEPGAAGARSTWDALDRGDDPTV